MMPALSVLAGLLAAAGIYMLLSARAARRLCGVVLLGQALPLVILADGGHAAEAAGAALVIAFMTFALFLGLAANFKAEALRELKKPGGGAS